MSGDAVACDRQKSHDRMITKMAENCENLVTCTDTDALEREKSSKRANTKATCTGTAARKVKHREEPVFPKRTTPLSVHNLNCSNRSSKLVTGMNSYH